MMFIALASQCIVKPVVPKLRVVNPLSGILTPPHQPPSGCASPAIRALALEYVPRLLKPDRNCHSWHAWEDTRPGLSPLPAPANSSVIPTGGRPAESQTKAATRCRRAATLIVSFPSRDRLPHELCSETGAPCALLDSTASSGRDGNSRGSKLGGLFPIMCLALLVRTAAVELPFCSPDPAQPPLFRIIADRAMGEGQNWAARTIAKRGVHPAG